MAYFDQEFLTFFSELEQNNHKEWFHANKKTYEKKVKMPFRAFIGDLILALEDHWGNMPFEARDFILRINRDIRFSKDKTPYKIMMEAMLSKYGRKEMTRPGIFLQASHKGISLYTGSYLLKKENLYYVRKAIVENPETFQSLISDKKFVSTFGEVLGDKNKRIDKEFREAAESQPLIFNKGFYYGCDLGAQVLLEDNLIPELMKRFEVANGMNGFLEEALNR